MVAALGGGGGGGVLSCLVVNRPNSAKQSSSIPTLNDSPVPCPCGDAAE